MSLSETYAAGDTLPAADVVDFAKRINRSYFPGLESDFFGLEADVPTGWLLEDGGTIGDASSGASKRANADMADLFAILWAVGNTYATLSILTSAGAGSTYGANAAADFAAHKRIALPDMRGRVSAGRDNMGGSDAGRIVTNNSEGNKVGGVAGAEEHTLVDAEVPSQQIKFRSGSGGGATSRIDISGSADNFQLGTGGDILTYTTEGGGGAHNSLQPTSFRNKIICTGVVW